MLKNLLKLKYQALLNHLLQEYLTEGAQTGLSQVSVGSQLELETDLNLGYTKFLNGEEILEAAEAGGWVGGLLRF